MGRIRIYLCKNGKWGDLITDFATLKEVMKKAGYYSPVDDDYIKIMIKAVSRNIDIAEDIVYEVKYR